MFKKGSPTGTSSQITKYMERIFGRGIFSESGITPDTFKNVLSTSDTDCDANSTIFNPSTSNMGEILVNIIQHQQKKKLHKITYSNLTFSGYISCKARTGDTGIFELNFSVGETRRRVLSVSKTLMKKKYLPISSIKNGE